MAKEKNKSNERRLMLPEEIDSNTYAYSYDFMQKFIANKTDFESWGQNEVKIFALFLSAIDWKKGNNSHTIELSIEHIAKELKWNFEERRFAGKNIRALLKHMTDNCMVRLYNPHLNEYIQAPLITLLHSKSNTATLQINPVFMPHFEDLFTYNEITSKGFQINLLNDTIDSENAGGATLYAILKSYHTKGGNGTYSHIFSTSKLKTIFKLDVDDYTSVREVNGEKKPHFDRSNFERKRLEPALEDANNSRMINIKRNPDGKLYKKVKENGKIIGYEIQWTVYDIETTKRIEAKKIRENKGQTVIKDKGIKGDPRFSVVELEPDLSELYD